jgi:hypothetical protein
MSSPAVQIQDSPAQLGDEARLRLGRVYVLLIGLVENESADPGDPAANQAPESADAKPPSRRELPDE